MAHEILEGYRVIDMTMFQLGPVNGMMLATMGAEVIKIEPPQGETGRINGSVMKGGQVKGFEGMDLSAYYENNNRLKKSMVLDLNGILATRGSKRHGGIKGFVRDGQRANHFNERHRRCGVEEVDPTDVLWMGHGGSQLRHRKR